MFKIRLSLFVLISLGIVSVHCGLEEAQENSQSASESFLITLIQQNIVQGICSIDDGGDQSLCVEYKGLSWDEADVNSACNASGGVSSTHPDSSCSRQSVQGTCEDVSRRIFYYTETWADDASAREDCLDNQLPDDYNANPEI